MDILTKAESKVVTPWKVIENVRGLVTKIDPARIESGVESYPSLLTTGLAQGVSVDVDIASRIGRRKGYAPTIRTQDIRDLFCDGGDCLFIYNNSLYRLNSNMVGEGLRDGLTPSMKMWYVQIEDKIFYSNSFESGVYFDNISHPWLTASYEGSDSTRVMSPVPKGKHLAVYNGRIYLSSQNIIWFTEPFAYYWVDLARNFVPFGTKVRMIRPVEGGIYVSTEREIIFFGGSGPGDFIVKRLATYPAVEGTDLLIDGSMIGKSTEKVAIFTTWAGICVGTSDGTLVNLTEKDNVIPTCNRGSAVYMNGKYIALLEP